MFSDRRGENKFVKFIDSTNTKNMFVLSTRSVLRDEYSVNNHRLEHGDSALR